MTRTNVRESWNMAIPSKSHPDNGTSSILDTLFVESYVVDFGADGDIEVVLENDDEATTTTFKGRIAGTQLPFKIKKIISTGTTISETDFNVVRG